MYNYDHPIVTTTTITTTIPAAAAAAAVAPVCVRVKAITIKDAVFETTAASGAVLWGALDRCVVPAEQRAQASANSRTITDSDPHDISAALGIVNIEFPYRLRLTNSILAPLTTEYPALVRSLQVLRIKHNNYDESADLGAFAVLGTHLQELTFLGCGLTSVRGLEGRCEYLRKINVHACLGICSLEGLEHHLYLEEVAASFTPIVSIEPLRLCPALTKVYFNSCRQISSIKGLEGHQWLQFVAFAFSSPTITSIEPLRSCPALETVFLFNCQHLSSIEGLEGHERLQEVQISGTAITSIEPLRSCPALTKVFLYGCRQVSSIEALEGHRFLQEVDASDTGIASIEPLRTCPALTKVYFSGCGQVSSVEALERHQFLQEVNASKSGIVSLEPLRTCPALTKIVLSASRQPLNFKDLTPIITFSNA